MHEKNLEEELIQKVWEKGRIIPNLFPDEWRFDAGGALINKSQFGENTIFGWKFESILLGINDEVLDNLRPIQWQNQMGRKGDFPQFSYDTTYSQQSKTNVGVHPPIINELEVDLQLSLREIYPDHPSFK